MSVADKLDDVKEFFSKNLLRAKVLKDVYAEREYQDEKWGGKTFDTTHSEADWLTWINEYANGTGRAVGRDFRERMIKTAALAVAAVEALDAKKDDAESEKEVDKDEKTV